MGAEKEAKAEVKARVTTKRKRRKRKAVAVAAARVKVVALPAEKTRKGSRLSGSLPWSCKKRLNARPKSTRKPSAPGLMQHSTYLGWAERECEFVGRLLNLITHRVE